MPKVIQNTFSDQSNWARTNKNKNPENPHVYSERNKRGIKTSINEGSNAGIEKHKRQKTRNWQM